MTVILYLLSCRTADGDSPRPTLRNLSKNIKVKEANTKAHLLGLVNILPFSLGLAMIRLLLRLLTTVVSLFPSAFD